MISVPSYKKLKNHLARCGMLIASTALFASFSSAQEVKSNEPTKTTAVYGDWLVRCSQVKLVKDGTESDPVNACEMVNVIRVKTPASKDANGKAVPERTQVLAQIVMGKPVGKDKIRTIFQLPGGVWLREPVSLKFADTAETVDAATGEFAQIATYFSCGAQACLADLELDQAQVSALSASKFAQLGFIDGARRTFKVPVSMNGFGGAYKAITQ